MPGAADSIVVRDARPEELDEVAAALLAAYDQYASATDDPDYGEVWRNYREDIADVRWRLDQGAELIVAERDGEIAGSVTFYPDGSKAQDTGWPKEWAGIRLLGVVPAARGTGIGRLLTEECLRRARASGAKTVGLHTTEFMAVARGMYERIGFHRVPDLDIDVGAGITVLGYRLDLSPPTSGGRGRGTPS